MVKTRVAMCDSCGTWGEIPEITFGRVNGPPYRHVQLRSQTVSRQHARMHYVRWSVENDAISRRPIRS